MLVRSFNTFHIFFFIILITGTSSAFMSCQKDDFKLDTGVRLTFSTDTLLFDTVFNAVGSTTRRIKVFNKTNQNIAINEIYLGGKRATGQSAYKLNINGMPANEVKNMELAKGDSLYVFVEVIINPTAANLPFIVSDSVMFDTGKNNIQKIQLDAFGQNANFLVDSVLTCNAVWTNNKPYVIYNSVLVPKNCKLTIEQGVRVHSHKGSFIFVAGELKINGTLDNPVRFKSDRLDEDYKELPGLWGGIHLLTTSRDNEINYAEIKNGIYGIRVDSLSTNNAPKLNIQNTNIDNMVLAGIIGFTGSIVGANLLITDCGSYNFVGDLGGVYEFRHCTFANVGAKRWINHTKPTFVATNNNYVLRDYRDTYDSITRPNNLKLTLKNNIVWGGLEDEIVVEQSGQGTSNLTLNNNLLKAKKRNFGTVSNIFDRDPKFKNPSKYIYLIDTLSPAHRAGADLVPQFPSLARDLKGTTRASTPTLGCLERKE